MCGICGVINHDGSPADPAILSGMARMMCHRGPDDIGLHVDGPAGFAMVRLAVIDPDGGHQPMHTEQKNIWTVCNAEIYNFEQLRAELSKKGHLFYNRTDVEPVGHLYEDFGADLVSHLRGEFAIAVWDSQSRSLLLARDHIGVKPLYYYADDRIFIFASEIKAILHHPAVVREVDPDAINEYMTWHYVPAPRTIFKRIHKIPPGHRLVLQNKHIDIRQYWDVHYNIDYTARAEEITERLLVELSEAVRIRMVSDVPLGAFLSGGIDSSAVVALMARQSSKPVKTFCVGFEEQSYSELEHARTVAKAFGTDHTEYVLKPAASDIADDILWYFDEPFADSSALPTFMVARAARQHVTVALSGDGGDEVFGGYERYARELALARYGRIPAVIRKLVLRNLSRMLPSGFYGKNFMHHITLDDDSRFINSMHCVNANEKDQLYTTDFATRLNSIDCSQTMAQHFDAVADQDFLTRMLYADAKTYLPGDGLVKVDRMASANSLEVRVPMLDHKLIEFAATIPAALKYRDGTGKYILRKAMEGILPPGILQRGKQGFAIPAREWLAKDWNDSLRQILFEPRTIQRGYFQKKYIDRLLREHVSGRRNHQNELWAMWVLELWHRQYIDADPAQHRHKQPEQTAPRAAAYDKVVHEGQHH